MICTAKRQWTAYWLPNRMARCQAGSSWINWLIFITRGPGPVFSYKYDISVEMAISTNQKPTIYRNLYENVGSETSVFTANVRWVLGHVQTSQWIKYKISEHAVDHPSITHRFHVYSSGYESRLTPCLLISWNNREVYNTSLWFIRII